MSQPKKTPQKRIAISEQLKEKFTNEETTNEEQNNRDKLYELLNESNIRNNLEVLEFINNNELTLTKEILNEDEIIEMILNEVNEINDESGEGTDEPEATVGDNDALGAINKLLIYI
ncbi:10443_t:CDS:1 [Entrophospora sp. SA101]|nr:10443_t:CDS:1 [Entrophospora sp. SA101]